MKLGLRRLPLDADLGGAFERLADSATIRVAGDTPTLVMREPLRAFCLLEPSRFRDAMTDADRLAAALDLRPVGVG